MARQSVSKHLAVLEGANLVTTVRRGREKLHYLSAEPINAIAERWISRYDQERVHALADLKHVLESNAMGSNAFVYTTYIRTTPERPWQGLTDPEFTRRYWGEFGTDWAAGSPVVWRSGGPRPPTPSRSSSSPIRPVGCRTPDTPSRRNGRRPTGSTTRPSPGSPPIDARRSPSTSRTSAAAAR
ncbi:hypothetical protein [Streptomyces sp. NPDC059906]|uniref:ArsR/SmtB family transcription factor n=1 Tax=Streptomyces sp. NPDC059906 TaxID=3346997 RepID=UPI00364D7340